LVEARVGKPVFLNCSAPWFFIEPFIVFAFHNWNTASNPTIQISQLQLSYIQIAQVK